MTFKQHCNNEKIPGSNTGKECQLNSNASVISVEYVQMPSLSTESTEI